MRAVDFPFHAIKRFTFSPSPYPLPASLRPLYQIALIALVLKANCQGNTASLLKLQFFNWVLKSPSLQKSIEERFAHQTVFQLELIHLDPMVNLALRYAFADNLITVTRNSKFKLTERGVKFAERILQDDQPVLVAERDLLKRIGYSVSEVKLRKELL